MSRKDRLPKGRVQLYCYVKDVNKAMLTDKAKRHGLSESKILDLILDKTRKEGASFEVTQIINI